VQLTARALAAWLAATAIFLPVGIASRVAVLWHVHALNMGALGELRYRERVIRREVSVAKSSQLLAWISRIEHS
jgi:hypothetical protein